MSIWNDFEGKINALIKKTIKEMGLADKIAELKKENKELKASLQEKDQDQDNGSADQKIKRIESYLGLK